MPISLILTPFYHFHFRPALAVKRIPDLRVCHNAITYRLALTGTAKDEDKLQLAIPHSSCNHLYHRQCKLFDWGDFFTMNVKGTPVVSKFYTQRVILYEHKVCIFTHSM